MWPLAVINWMRGLLHNRLFDIGVWKSVEFEMPVIYVGSLADEPTIGLSKYIQNLTKGALHVSRYRLPELGLEKREQLNYYTELSKENTFCTSHKVLGLSEWYQNHEDTSVFIMDGEFSKNEIRPQLRVLVTDFDRPFTGDQIYPVGYLNLPKKEAQNADTIIVANTPAHADIGKMESYLLWYLKSDVPIFFIMNTIESLKSFNSVDKIEFISDRNNFERLILSLLPNANPDSE